MEGYRSTVNILLAPSPTMVVYSQLHAVPFFGLLSFFSTIVAISSIIITPALSTSVHELFVMYGLPGGLLPTSVKSYTFSDDGELVVHMESPCYIHFTYLVYYDHKISAKICNGSITDLKGIQVQSSFLLWLSVDEIRVYLPLPSADSIYFQVGYINKKLDINQFRAVRSCYTANQSPPALSSDG